MKRIFYDFECFKYDWLVVLIEQKTREKTVIINNREMLQAFYDAHKNDIFCGYNSRTYDQVVLKGILQGKNAATINDEIINQGKKEFQILDKDNPIPLINYDCLLLNKSLKQLEGFLGLKIKESSIPFDIDRPLTQAEIEETVYYCTHDVESTIEVFENTENEFEAMYGLITMFDLPLTTFSKTKSQIAALIMGASRENNRGDEFDLIIPNTMVLGDKYKHIPEWYMNERNHNYSRKLLADVAGVPHVFGYGGIHGAVPNLVYDGWILCCDVASLYPSIIIEYGYMSRCVKDPDKYRQIRDTRLEYKKLKDPRQKPLKIVLNSLYGCEKDEYNPLYDPRQSNNVCLTGQLLLLDLIEKLEPYCRLAQSNTDGLFLLVDDRSKIDTIKAVAHEWEVRTKLSLEWDEYRRLVQKDVNNYILIDAEGHYKSKGAYLKSLSPIDSDLPIVNEALINYFVNSTPLRDTIERSTRLMDFQKIVKISSLYSYATVEDEEVKEKTLRVFASKNQSRRGIFKVKRDGEGNLRVEKIANTPYRCFVYNDDIRNIPIPDELDREYYVGLAETRLEAFLSEEDKPKRIKSEIKGINVDVYNAILDLEFGQFSNFIECLVYIKEHGLANKTQVRILTALDYFHFFGKRARLFKVEDEFYDGAMKYSSNHSYKRKATVQEALVDLYDNEPDEDISYFDALKYREKYLGNFVTNNPADAKAIFVTKVWDAKRKADGKKFGMFVKGTSIGTGKTSVYTVPSFAWSKNEPLDVDDVFKIIECHSENGFFRLIAYKKMKR